ncbi:hypothetical protein SAMN05880501_102171 [Ureibacillus xyleni]|uniref:Uncharacterized protein n=1 Tax=Ureibacillus xyleni TaxID=614648 RepID=A0A285RYU2_9BACL|nr:hypothetical protein [Ureibacillus xyleni]SOB99240.1 hypothetical protein SAMN05880501_102171 [Ureibacillus xyleni]
MSEVLLKQILEEIYSMKNEIHLMKDDINSMKDEIHSMKDEIYSMKDEIHSMKEDIHSMKEDIHSLKETQYLMIEQLNETSQIVLAIRDRQEETDAKLDALSMDVQQLHGKVSDHDESIKLLTEIQKQQQQLLETLSLRSINHETELRYLKQV